jgi:hypothetical protein
MISFIDVILVVATQLVLYYPALHYNSQKKIFGKPDGIFPLINSNLPERKQEREDSTSNAIPHLFMRIRQVLLSHCF